MLGSHSHKLHHKSRTVCMANQMTHSGTACSICSCHLCSTSGSDLIVPQEQPLSERALVPGCLQCWSSNHFLLVPTLMVYQYGCPPTQQLGNWQAENVTWKHHLLEETCILLYLRCMHTGTSTHPVKSRTWPYAHTAAMQSAGQHRMFLECHRTFQLLQEKQGFLDAGLTLCWL